MLKKLKKLFKNEYFKISSVCNDEIVADNRGSALILVIVTVGFVTILASIVMSSAIVNHKIRSIDRRTKDNFYYAEKALDDIYTGIGEDCAIAMGEAYSEVAAGNGNSYTFTNQEDAYKAYKTLFINKIWTKSYDKTALESYVTVKPGSGHKIDVDINPSNIKFLKKDGITAATITDDDAKILKIKSLKVTCTEEATGYISAISTDIVIDVPDAHFFTVQESPLDYAIIANKGIKFKSGITKVNGRVYAGNLSGSSVAYDIEDNADVTLVGDYLAARGDIDINSDSKLTLGKDSIGSRVWFENLKLSKNGATLEAGNRTGMFALGDLEINANNCTAKLGGAYYGYNNEAITSGQPDFKTKEYETLGSGRNSDNARNALSSSIIVNGNNATVDVSNLQTLLLMGRAYVDFSDKKKLDETDYEYATGEGFALKTNQEIYLVPQEFITGGYTNPAKESEVGTGFSFTGNYNIPSGWFGCAYLSASNKVRTVKVNDLYYAYLGLDKPGEYFERIADAAYDDSDVVSPTAYELKKKMEGSTANSIFSFNGLKFNPSANIYIHNGTTPNGASEFDSGYIYKSSNLGIGTFASYPNALYTKYRDLCTNLAAHENIALGAPVGDISDTDWNNADYPAKKFVKYDDIPTTSTTSVDTPAYKGNAADDTMYKADFWLDNAVYGTVSVQSGNITQGNALDGIFLFVDGDVEITAGSTINGMIIATGTVTINGGSSGSETVITSDNSLLQKRIDKELSNARHALANGRYDSVNSGNVYKSDYVISYLLDPTTGDRLYKYIAEDTYTDVVKEVTQSIPTDYKQYVTLDNWKKGE